MKSFINLFLFFFTIAEAISITTSFVIFKDFFQKKINIFYNENLFYVYIFITIVLFTKEFLVKNIDKRLKINISIAIIQALIFSIIIYKIMYPMLIYSGKNIIMS